MGDFYLRGCISNISIMKDEDVVMFLAIHEPKTSIYYPCDTIIPISLPIYAKYNGHGGIKDIEETPVVDWLRNMIGNPDDIVEAFNNCENVSIKNCLSTPNDYKYIYKNLLERSVFITKDTRLILAFEHRCFYDKWISENNRYEMVIRNHKKYDFYKGDDLKELVNDDIRKTFSGFCKDEFSFLCLHLDYHVTPQFIISQKEEINHLLNFLTYLKEKQLCFNPPLQYTTLSCEEEQIEYHQDCIDFLKKRYDKYN